MSLFQPCGLCSLADERGHVAGRFRVQPMADLGLALAEAVALQVRQGCLD